MVCMRGTRDANCTGGGLRRTYRISLTVAERLRLDLHSDSVERCLEAQSQSDGIPLPVLRLRALRPSQSQGNALPAPGSHLLRRLQHLPGSGQGVEPAQLAALRERIYRTTIRLERIPSMEPYPELGISPRLARHPLSRLREAGGSNGDPRVGGRSWLA